MQCGVFQRVLVNGSGVVRLLHLVGVLFVVYVAVADDVPVGHPYLSADPYQFIDVSLYDLSFARFAYLQVVVGRVVAAVV